MSEISRTGAASEVFGIPELLSNILKHATRGTLFSAIQVNSLWANEGIKWLWRGTWHNPMCPGTGAIQSLESYSQKRRGWYTKNTQFIAIQQEHMSRKSVKFMKNMLDQSEISFPNAKSILIDIGTPNMKEDDIAMLLQHNLIALQLNGGYSSTWFLRQVKRSAPKLRLLHLENGPWEDEWYPDLNFYSHAGWHPNPNWDPDVTNSANFIIAFKEQPNITHIELGQGWDNIIEEDLLTYFLLRPNLEMLCLGDNLPLLWPAMACLETDYPDAQILPKIRFLDISADKKSVKLLLSNLENLQGIHLEWKENMAEDAANGGFSRCEVLSWLSTCPRLEEIDLSGDVDLAIPLESFMDLAESCPLLRSLKIRNEFCCGDSETKVPEGFFEKLGHWITNLEQVHLPLSGAMSAECLEFFSRSCQNLNSPKPFKSTRARLLERLIEPIPGSKYNPET